MNARLRRYYMKKIYGGRSIVARLLDFVVFRTLLMLGLFMLILQLSRSLTMALLVSIFLTLAVSLVLTRLRTRRIERYIEKDLKQLREKCLLETLTFMEIHDFIPYISRLLGGLENISPMQDGFCAEQNGAHVRVFHNHPSTKCDIADILGVLRQNKGRRIVLVTLSEFSQAARTLCRGREPETDLISGEDVLSLAAKAGLLPDEQAARQKAEDEMNDSVMTLSKLKNTALSRTKVKGYMICGIAAVFWPFVTGFRFYYPIIAAVCFALAIFTYRKGQNAKESSIIGTS